MMCQERSGFLFAHECDQGAVRACGVCHKSVCDAHSRVHEGAHYCITCFQQVATAPGETDPDAAADRRPSTPGSDALDDGGDDPYTYSSRHYRSYRSYDTDDYRAFDRSTSTPVEADDEKDFAGS